jgi:peptidoglycan/LPS O-acetylase OafA/YrhL
MPLFMLGLFAIARIQPAKSITRASIHTNRTFTKNDTQIITTTKRNITTRVLTTTPPKGSIGMAFGYWIAVLIVVLLAHFWILNNLIPESTDRGWQYGLIGGAKFWMPNYNPIGWFSHYIIGVLCAGAIAYRQQQQLGRSRNMDYAVGISIFLIITWIWSTRYTPEFAYSLGLQPYAFPVFPSLIAILLFCAAFGLRAPKLLNHFFIRYTATLSFGIYIWHYIILELVRLLHNADFKYGGIENPIQWFGMSMVVFIASYAMANLSYAHIEKPFLPRSTTK